MRISDWSSDVCSSDLVAKALDGRGLRKRGEGRPFYLVGGSWRALARLDMLLVDYPLPITHQYRMEPGRLDELADGLAGLDMAVLKRVPSFSMSRWPPLPDAHLLPEILVKALQPSALIVPSFRIPPATLFDGLAGAH